MLYVKSHSFSASDLLDVIVEYFHNSLGRIPALHRLASLGKGADLLAAFEQ